MAKVNITVRRDSGTTITAEGEVDDMYIVEIATMLGAMLFDSASTTAVSPGDTPAE